MNFLIISKFNLNISCFIISQIYFFSIFLFRLIFKLIKVFFIKSLYLNLLYFIKLVFKLLRKTLIVSFINQLFSYLNS